MTTRVHDDTNRQSPERVAPDTVAPRRRSRVWTFLAVVAVLVALAVGGLALLVQLIPEIPNPFATDQVDRSRPAVLLALEDLSEYRAATGHFQVIIDVEDDARFLPSALRGQRTLFVASGTVDASVDFSGLAEDAVEVSQDRTRASIVLPGPHLSEPRIDPDDSYVYERRRGLLDRIGGLFSDDSGNEQELYQLAEERLRQAAAETDLTRAAERNTRAMLRTLLGSLGFSEVEVTFD